MRAVPQLLLALCAICSATLSDAADPKAALARVQQVCAACHGIDGNSQVADNPKLGGQYPDYLAKALRDYQSGLRKSPVMAGFVDKLSNQDIENLAAYYASQPAALVIKQ
ncbi:MAG TPA: cytochrome c [Casimicrobiaceae bacterium]|nr:cytochrome c [Casimicrobiaceae bacterium]